MPGNIVHLHRSGEALRLVRPLRVRLKVVRTAACVEAAHVAGDLPLNLVVLREPQRIDPGQDSWVRMAATRQGLLSGNPASGV